MNPENPEPNTSRQPFNMRKAARLLFTISAFMLLAAIPFRLYLLILLMRNGQPILSESILIASLALGAFVMLKLRKKV